MSYEASEHNLDTHRCLLFMYQVSKGTYLNSSFLFSCIEEMLEYPLRLFYLTPIALCLMPMPSPNATEDNYIIGEPEAAALCSNASRT